LCNYDILIEQALLSDYVSESDLVSLKEWKDDPENWKASKK
jgi:orotate phosphoribosyltransferase